MQENRESLEQFFAKYGEAGKKVFEEDTDDDEDKETMDEEGNGEEEEKYVKNMMQGTDLTTQGDKLKKKVQTDLKEILQVTDKEGSQVADILHVLKESEGGKEKEQMGAMFLLQSALRETNVRLYNHIYVKPAL